MDLRKKKILKAIIQEYTKNAAPVSSQLIAEKKNVSVSPATIRNEMAILEEWGYIAQPHTSAGRVPTIKGYQYYIDHFLTERDLSKREKLFLKKLINLASVDDVEEKIKQFAKGIAELSHLCAFVGFKKFNYYYTGISYLFSQPEFVNHNLIYNISEIIDAFDRVLTEIIDMMQSDIEICIGDNNPFGPQCSSIVSLLPKETSQEGIFGILGPLRQDYQKNYSLIVYGRDILKMNSS